MTSLVASLCGNSTCGTTHFICNTGDKNRREARLTSDVRRQTALAMQLFFSPDKNLIHDAETGSEKTTDYNPPMTLMTVTVQKGDDSGLSIK